MKNYIINSMFLNDDLGINPSKKINALLYKLIDIKNFDNYFLTLNKSELTKNAIKPKLLSSINNLYIFETNYKGDKHQCFIKYRTDEGRIESAFCNCTEYLNSQLMCNHLYYCNNEIIKSEKETLLDFYFDFVKKIEVFKKEYDKNYSMYTKYLDRDDYNDIKRKITLLKDYNYKHYGPTQSIMVAINALLSYGSFTIQGYVNIDNSLPQFKYVIKNMELLDSFCNDAFTNPYFNNDDVLIKRNTKRFEFLKECFIITSKRYEIIRIISHSHSDYYRQNNEKMLLKLKEWREQLDEIMEEFHHEITCIFDGELSDESYLNLINVIIPIKDSILSIYNDIRKYITIY